MAFRAGDFTTAIRRKATKSTSRPSLYPPYPSAFLRGAVTGSLDGISVFSRPPPPAQAAHKYFIDVDGVQRVFTISVSGVVHDMFPEFNAELIVNKYYDNLAVNKESKCRAMCRVTTFNFFLRFSPRRGIADNTDNAVGIEVQPCHHMFHRSCIDRWQQTSHTSAPCPLCRSHLGGLTLSRPA